jgi:hypothetical protein
MANITLVAPVLLASLEGLQRISCVAGEAFDPEGGSTIAAYIGAAGTALKAVSTVAAGAQFDGFVITKAAAGDPVTIFQQGYKVRIGAHGLAVGAFLYPSDTAGKLSDVSIATPVLDVPVAKAISATEVEITRMDQPPALNP